MASAIQKLKKIILEETNLYLKEMEETDLGVPFSDDIPSMSEESMTEEILRVLRKSDFYNLAREEYNRESGSKQMADSEETIAPEKAEPETKKDPVPFGQAGQESSENEEK